MKSKFKENLTRTLLKLFENESKLFTGTDSRSWDMQLKTFIELAETHEAQKCGNVTSTYLLDSRSRILDGVR